MIHSYLLLCLFSISAFFLSGTVAREAIFGGHIVPRNLIPYQLSVQSHGYDPVCGGGIMGDHFILTAAHCVVDEHGHIINNRISVLAGTNNLNNTNSPAITIRVNRVFFPSEFISQKAFKTGDIAVLKLEGPLPLHQHSNLGKLTLPHNNKIARMSPWIAGFGKSRTKGTDGFLRIAVAEVLSNERCEDAYPRGAIKRDRHLCSRTLRDLAFDPSASGHHGPCTSDAGGPLVESRIVIGVLSRITPHCNDRHEPAVYTNVFHYAEMISGVMKNGDHPDMISLSIHTPRTL